MVAAGQIIRASDVRHILASYQLIGAHPDSTPTTSYTSKAGAVTPALVKAGNAETNLVFDLFISGFQITTLSTMTFGVFDGGTDWDVCRFSPSALSTRIAVAGRAVLTGLASGSYTAQLRHKAVSGTTVFRQAAADDFTCMSLWEVLAP